MKAMVLQQFNEPLVETTLPDPSHDENEIIIQVRANGLCATDLKIISGVVPTVSIPHVQGHEVSGEVVSVGSKVPGLALGDRVTVYPTRSCGFCDYCRLGMENYCSDAPRTGFEIDGGFSDYMVYEGWKLKGWPVKTIIRGQTISEDFQVVGKLGYGKLVSRKTNST